VAHRCGTSCVASRIGLERPIEATTTALAERGGDLHDVIDLTAAGEEHDVRPGRLEPQLEPTALPW
jgi:hypothetical protein